MLLQDSVCLPETIVDSHVHGRDWHQAYKTTLGQTLREAKSGGISVSFFMPNTDEALINRVNVGVYRNILRSAEIHEAVHNKQYIYFGVTDENLAECNWASKKDYICGYKVYPKKQSGETVTTGSIGVCHDATIANILNLSQYSGKPVAFHCDDPEIISREGNAIRAEAAYVAKILLIARDFPYAKIVICHCSCRESAELVIAAQKAKMWVALELCPHYLWFDADGTNWRTDINPVFYHCFNSLRSAEHREFLVSLLADGGPFVICGSDTAGHTREEKLGSKPPGGIPSNQEMAPVILTLAKQHGISNKRVIDLLSQNAIQFFGLRVPMGVRAYRLEKRRVSSVYNQGVIENPWAGSELYFPVPVKA